MTNCCDLILDSNFSFRTFFQGADILLLFTTLLFYFFFQCQKHLIRINEKRTGSWFEAICVFYSDGRGHSTKSLFKSFFYYSPETLIKDFNQWNESVARSSCSAAEKVDTVENRSKIIRVPDKCWESSVVLSTKALTYRAMLWVKSETRYLLALKTILDGGLIKATL